MAGLIAPLQIKLTMAKIECRESYASCQTTYLKRKTKTGIGSLDKEPTQALLTKQSIGAVAGS